MVKVAIYSGTTVYGIIPFCNVWLIYPYISVQLPLEVCTLANVCFHDSLMPFIFYEKQTSSSSSVSTSVPVLCD